MDAILIDNELELNGYVLNYSAELSQAEILVTQKISKGETAVVAANVNFKYDTIFTWYTLDGYHIHRHSDYEAFVRRIISLLFEKVEIWEKEPSEE